ncbi:hypothetical protein N5S92_08380 [Aliarcobacter cryaerophilus]|uniref:hypothetical protein n=1 Tax=Aliarcobacter cryaerophilus TaxID=28198 RepID=UPI0021B18194|nr:hypothetical protein [Aliarcobacter cryaerophilus]MCT7502007.1 hypothetical protein [Aliarcobacter cryaerophilus]
MHLKFDDYKYKKIDKKLQFTLKQETEKNMSPWELSSFINNFNNYYYKNEILNTIAIALNKNISPENILIFDESFKLNRIYGKLKNISLKNSDLKYLYTLGKPVSLFPNQDIFILNLLFKYFRNINEFLYQKFHKSLSSNEIYIYYNVYKQSDFNSLIINLQQGVNKILSKKKANNKDIIKNLNNIFLNLKEDFNIFTQNQNVINNLTSNLKNKNFDLSTLDSDNVIYKKYFLRFSTLINVIQRPVVAIYDEQTQSIDILCRAHINKNERNAVTLDLKSLTRNSPITGIFNSGLHAITTITNENRLNDIHKYNIEIKELEIIKQQKEIEKLEADLEIKKIQILREKIAVIKALNEFVNSDEINAIRMMENPYLKNQINELSEEVHNKTKQLLYNNKFELEETIIINA